MATNVTSSTVADIVWYLTTLRRDWEGAVDLVSRWDALDALEQEDLIVEWPLTIERLLFLLHYRRTGRFLDEHERQFQDIRQFMRDHVAEIERVLGPGQAMIDPPTVWVDEIARAIP